MKKSLMMVLVALCCSTALAAIEIPKASGKALGVTKGKEFSNGVVFVNGRYLEPPYIVERWGVGIRINKIPVVGQVVDWTEFLKTQAGVKAVKSETESEPAQEEATAEETTETDGDENPAETASNAKEAEGKSETASADEETSLDDLFEDDSDDEKTDAKATAAKKSEAKDGKSRNEKAKKPPKAVSRKTKPSKPAATVSYTLEGPFVPNDATRSYLSKINKVRTDINATLLAGGFICFGENYARVSGDARTADEILRKLPDIQKKSNSAKELTAAVRSAYLVYLTEPVCQDLYEHRRDYLKLKARWEKTSSDRAFNKLLDDAADKPRL